VDLPGQKLCDPCGEVSSTKEEAEDMSRQPKRDLRRRQQRRRKVRALRERLENTTSPDARRKLIAKIKKISPTAPVPTE
jgi:indole-3-glycerol phosphate synthase